MQDNRDLMNDFDWAGKTKLPACKTLRVWTKNEEHFENFQENFEISGGWKNYVSAFCTVQRAHSCTLTRMHLRNF